MKGDSLVSRPVNLYPLTLHPLTLHPLHPLTSHLSPLTFHPSLSHPSPSLSSHLHSLTLHSLILSLFPLYPTSSIFRLLRLVRRMILAKDPANRAQALLELGVIQKSDFEVRPLAPILYK